METNRMITTVTVIDKFTPPKRKLAKSNRLNKDLVYRIYSEFVNDVWYYKFDAGKWIKSRAKFPKLKRIFFQPIISDMLDLSVFNNILPLESDAAEFYYLDTIYGDSQSKFFDAEIATDAYEIITISNEEVVSRPFTLNDLNNNVKLLYDYIEINPNI